MSKPERLFQCECILKQLTEPRYEGDQAKAALAVLGLELADFEKVGEAALAHYRRVSPLYPKPYAGQSAHAGATAKLREQLMARGWVCRDPKNSAWICHPETGMCIVVATGDEGTGVVALPVGTKSKKGLVVGSAVQNNARLTGMEQTSMPWGEKTEKKPELLWFLLISMTKTGVIMELALPNGMDGKGMLTNTHRRIILPMADATPRVSADDVASSQPPIDIPLEPLENEG